MWYLPETLRELEDAGDESLVRELIESFQDDTASRFERLLDALARLDDVTVKEEAHSIKGSARQMGAEALANLCQTVEAHAPEKNWLELESQLNQAEMRFAEARHAMSEYVKGTRRAG